ncbi:polyketide cyclase [Jatrophihabitans sp. DSM 45814]
MAQEERISTTRRVKAPATKIFELVSRPDGHVKIDGSGMLLAAPDATPVAAVGDTFAMHMDRRPLGDIPDMAEYDVTVIITGFEQDTLLEWSVMTPKGNPYGHVYGYQLEAAGDGETIVTSYCDWSGLPEKRKDPSRWPIVPLHMLEKSLDNLEGIVTA